LGTAAHVRAGLGFGCAGARTLVIVQLVFFGVTKGAVAICGVGLELCMLSSNKEVIERERGFDAQDQARACTDGHD
jgi:hypothetical protein